MLVFTVGFINLGNAQQICTYNFSVISATKTKKQNSETEENECETETMACNVVIIINLFVAYKSQFQTFLSNTKSDVPTPPILAV